MFEAIERAQLQAYLTLPLLLAPGRLVQVSNSLPGPAYSRHRPAQATAQRQESALLVMQLR